MRLTTYLLLFGLCGGVTAHAQIRTEAVEYKDGDTVLEGFVVFDGKSAAKRPGVLVIHEWTGVGPYVKKRAEQLAKLGYTAFVADIYGKGQGPKDQSEAGKVSAIYKNDRKLFRRRAQLALDQLAKHKTVDSKKLGAMGYCFGGTGALELARSGAPLLGVVSFHGGLDTPDVRDAKNIKGKVLVLHGADDPYVPPTQVGEFEDEMRAAKVDWQIVKYSNAVHAFTNPDAGNDNSKGAAYNAIADKRSWEDMADFFKEIFGR